MQIGTFTMENNLTLSGKMLFTLGPAIQLLVIYSRGNFAVEYQEISKRSIVYSSPKLERTQISIFRMMHKSPGVPAYDRVLSMNGLQLHT